MENSGQMAGSRCPGVRRVPSSVAAFLALLALPTPAIACFFYEEPEDHSVVDQSALEVLLVEREGTTTMIVGARAEGNVPDLGWIVAVPNYPTPAEGSENVFSSLDFATRPVFRTSSGSGGTAYASESGGAGCGGADRAMGADSPPIGEDYPEVTVWNSTVVGPYLVDVVTARSPADLRAWVESNGFPWRPETEPDFQHYIDQSFFFVVAKVIPDEESAALVPLAITYPTADTELVVPLLLSRQAATEDMGLLVWIIADRPAKPSNWTQVAVPEEQIVVDSNEETSNYADLVARTVDAAGGQAFVTEFVRDAAMTAIEINDAPTRELIGTTGWVTRLYTRVDPGDITVDPVFVLDDTIAPVEPLHDLTRVENSPYWGAALRPVLGMSPVALVLLARLLRRRRFTI